MIKLDERDPHHRGLTRDASRHGVGVYVDGGNVLRIMTPDPRLMEPEMLAHSLSQLCRWTGHTKKFFSVAQHCVMVSNMVPRELALQGLLHDASEAFIGDINRPLKAIMDELAPGVLHDIEENIHEAIAKRFGSGYPHDPKIKEADDVAGATEMRDLLNIDLDSGKWFNVPKPLSAVIKPLGPTGARNAWLRRFRQLTEEK